MGSRRKSLPLKNNLYGLKWSAGELLQYLPADFFYCAFIKSNVIIWPMENTNLEILKQVEERKRIQLLKNIMRACKDKLYEDAVQERKNQK